MTSAVLGMRVEVLHAQSALRKADRLRAWALYHPLPARPVEADGVARCSNCERYEVWSVVHKAGRCRACYEYRRDHDRDAPANLVLARPEVGGRRRHNVP